jgi:TolB-like protein/Flp pilus assembly protein TadD
MGELKNIKVPVEIFRIVLPWEKQHHPLVERFHYMLRQQRTLKYGVAFALLSFVVYGAIELYFSQLAQEPIKSIAVLPFQNSRDVPEYLADGLTQGLINSLSQLPYLRVISGNSVFRYKGQSTNLARVGHDLRVDALLSGEIVQSRSGLSIDAELMDTRASTQIWNGQFNGRPSDILDITEEVTSQLAPELDIPLSIAVQQRLSRYYTTDKTAYDAYLRGLYHRQKKTKDDNSLAIEYFTQALKSDSAFGPALTALANAQEVRYEKGWSADGQLLTDASVSCQKALQLDSLNANAKANLGVIEGLLGNVRKAITLSEQALQVDENNLIALTQLGVLNIYYLGEPAKGVTYFKKVQEIEPLSAFVHNNLGVGYAQMKNLPAAHAAFQRAIQLDPSMGAAWNNLGIFYARTQNDSALICYRKVLQLNPRERLAYESLGALLLGRGEFSQAESLLVKGTMMLQSEHSLLYALGLSYGFAGNVSKAREILREGLLLVQQKLRKNPKAGNTHAFEGLFEARLGNDSVARACATKAFVLDSTNSDVVIKIARIYAVLREKDEMLEAFTHAKAMDPEYDAAYLATALDFERYRSDPDLLSIAREE